VYDDTSVVVTDIRMSFGSMVLFMVTWSIATIPAMIILAVIWVLVFVGISALLGYPIGDLP